MATFTVRVIPGWDFPEGAPIDLAALRAAAAPTIELLGELSTTSIGDGAVTEPKLATGAVSTRTIADGAVTEPKLADDAVSARALAPDSVADENILGRLSADVLAIFTGPVGGVLAANRNADRGSFLRGDGRWVDPTFNAANQLFNARNFI